MSSNKEQIMLHYENYSQRVGEDNRATSSRSQSLEFHYTKKAVGEYITNDTRVLEIGCGTGYYGLHFADKCKEYVGVDLFPPHIEIFNNKIADNNLLNVSCQVGDATNLSKIDDNSFDVVCCFGPMYHLPFDEREIVFSECNRVCKPGGVIAFAYTNKVGAYIGGCVLFSDVYPNSKANELILGLGITDSDAPFYFTMPEEMEEGAARHGLVKVRNMGTDSYITKNIVDKMDDEKFAEYMVLADEMVKYESCTGMSDHALLICRKPEQNEEELVT